MITGDEFFAIAIGVYFFSFQSCLLLLAANRCSMELDKSLVAIIFILFMSMFAGIGQFFALNLLPSSHWSLRNLQRLVIIFFYPVYIYMILIAFAHIKDSVQAGSGLSMWGFLKLLKKPNFR